MGFIAEYQDFVESTGPGVFTSKHDFVRRYRAERDRYVSLDESDAAWAWSASFREPLPSETRCGYCKALVRTNRCTNCGAGRGC